jgi:hypothetical protein
VVSVTDPYGRILSFLDRSRHFSIKYLLSCTHEAEWTPFQTHYFFFEFHKYHMKILLDSNAKVHKQDIFKLAIS